MSTELKPKEKEFVENYIKNDNEATQAVKDTYLITNDNYARVKGHRLIKKPKIQKAIKNIADEIPEEDLIRVHKEGLKAGKKIFKNNNESGEIEEVGYEPDYATRHKYLDTAYKLKGSYAPEKTVSLNVNIDLETKQKIDKAIEDVI